MLSRAAESIYWLHRYIERAENVARFIDVNLHLMLDFSPDSPEQWQPLVNTTGDRHDFARRYGTASKENVFTFLTHDAANPNSILSCLQAARDNARSVREIISSTCGSTSTRSTSWCSGRCGKRSTRRTSSLPR